MKKLSKMLVKGLLVITLFTGASVTLSTSGVRVVSEAHAVIVTDKQVYNYLTGDGYTIIDLQPITWYRTDDWYAHTTKSSVNYVTTIHVSGSSIVGHEDVVM